jgi:hypothetical protein
VLARRWRNLWKSVPTVAIYEEEEACFVTSLLLFRRNLDICSVKLEEHTLDFSCCPELDVLEMQDCEINAEKISCQSLRHLSMDMCSFPLGVRTRISCPSLTALELDDNVGLTPFLESMPSLVTAFVRFDAEWFEREEPGL